jgi:pyrroline-5-carboxylate reductase
MNSNITIIGAGNLGKAIAEGLLRVKYCKAEQLTLTKRNLTTLVDLKNKKVNLTSDNLKAVKNADIILLCVKPFQCMEVLKNISKNIKAGQILISVVSGINISEIESLVAKKVTVFRAMPNTAMSINQSITCMASTNNKEKEKQKVKHLFEALGKAIFIDEKLMDAATILGACGTAFAMRFIRAKIQAGIEIGFDAKTASLIAAQTVKGAADLLLINGTHPEEEIDKVTTPMGVTITGLNHMEHHGLSSSVIKGINESFKKMKAT